MDERNGGPAAAGTGFLVDWRSSCVDHLRQRRGTIIDAVPDVVKPFTPLLDGLVDGRVLVGICRQLDVAVAHLHERFLDTVAVDHLSMGDFGTECPGVEVDRRFEVANSDGNVVDVGDDHPDSFDVLATPRQPIPRPLPPTRQIGVAYRTHVRYDELMSGEDVGTREGATAMSADDATHPALIELLEWDTEQRRRDARRAELLAEVERDGVCDASYGHSTAGWLADRTQLSLGVARSLVRNAVRLYERFPELATALTAGRIGWQHVAAFQRLARPRIHDALAEMVPNLIELAEVAGFDRWHQELRGIVDLLDQDGGNEPPELTNNLSFATTLGGSITISGQLNGELALLVRQLVEQRARKVIERYKDDRENTGGAVDVPSWGEARAEALGELLNQAAGATTSKGAEPEVVVVVNANTGAVSDTDGERLSPTILQWALASGIVRALHVDEHGDPLRVGQAKRFATRTQRRALAIRDGGCVFPGCHRGPDGCDAHHVALWSPPNGGPTDIENLALLCRHHHRVTHRRGWHMERWHDPDRPHATAFRWQTPTGSEIRSQRHGKKAA